MNKLINIFKEWRDLANNESERNLLDAVIFEVKCAIDDEWIKNIPENAPKDATRKQIQLSNGWIITGYYDDGEWFSVPDDGDALIGVGAWRELPHPYEE